MVTEDKLEQSRKALIPMLVTLEGMVTEDKLEQFQNAPDPMLVTLYCTSPFIKEDGITTLTASLVY